MSLSILIVKDETAIAELIAPGLRAHGHKATIAPNAGEAQDLLSVLIFDLVVTDLTRPGAQGLELVSYLRRRHPHIPIVALTDHAAAQPPVDRAIETPFTIDAVHAAIESVLATRQRATA